MTLDQLYSNYSILVCVRGWTPPILHACFSSPNVLKSLLLINQRSPNGWNTMDERTGKSFKLSGLFNCLLMSRIPLWHIHGVLPIMWKIPRFIIPLPINFRRAWTATTPLRTGAQSTWNIEQSPHLSELLPRSNRQLNLLTCSWKPSTVLPPCGKHRPSPRKS